MGVVARVGEVLVRLLVLAVEESGLVRKELFGTSDLGVLCVGVERGVRETEEMGGEVVTAGKVCI